jgi:putative endonuclease
VLEISFQETYNHIKRGMSPFFIGRRSAMPFVYILECSDKTLYTGYALDIEKRLKQHNQGLASKYTRARLPVRCVYREEKETVSAALKREMEIKKMTREQKLDLIKSCD